MALLRIVAAPPPAVRTQRKLGVALAGALVILSAAGLVLALLSGPSRADDNPLTECLSHLGPVSYAAPDQVVAAFKAVMLANDFDGLAGLLGFEWQKLKPTGTVMETFKEMRAASREQLVLSNKDGVQVVLLGVQRWSMPFPIVKNDRNRWAFDTRAGIDEMVKRGRKAQC